MKLKFIKIYLVLASIFWIGSILVFASTAAGSGNADLEIDKSVHIDYPAEAPTNRLPIGAIEQVNQSGLVVGWALDPDAPDSNVEVDFYVNGPKDSGQLVGITTANVPRPDINQNAGYSGDHGFGFQLPTQFVSSAENHLYAYAKDIQTGEFSMFEYIKPIPDSPATATTTNFSLFTIPSKIFHTPQAAEKSSLFATVVVIPAGALSTIPIQIASQVLTPEGLEELLLILQRWWYELLVLLGLRKKRRTWGTVYDSETKQPLDPVIVTLSEASTGTKIEQSISDLAGRFGFLAKTGNFYITAQKTNYKFPSSLIAGNNDGIFNNIYHGEILNITSTSDVVAPNIPMDPQGRDWNQEEKTKLNLGGQNRQAALGKIITLVLNLLFVCGIILIVMSFLAFQNGITYLFLFLALLVSSYKFISFKRRLWGRLTFAAKPLKGYTLEISYTNLPTVRLRRALTAEDGKFFLRTVKGPYLLSIFNPNHELVKKFPFTGEEEGLLNKEVKLD